MLSIVRYPDPLLKKKCEAITVEELDQMKLSTGEDLFEVLGEMLRILRRDNALGLSAPQVGILKRFFICQLSEASDCMVVFFNPVLKCKFGLNEKADEGCLSIPNVFVPVSRPSQVKTSPPHSFYHEDNKMSVFQTKDVEEAEYELNGLDARVFQHEYDHLEGTLIIDRVSRKDRDKLGL